MQEYAVPFGRIVRFLMETEAAVICGHDGVNVDDVEVMRTANTPGAGAVSAASEADGAVDDASATSAEGADGAFIGDGSTITMSAVDSKTSTADNYNTVVADGTGLDSFNMIIKTDNLKLVPADYEVTLSSKGMAHFKSSKVQYWVAIETR